MSITFIARMNVFPEKEARYVEIIKQLEKDVAANEPGTLYYRFFKLDGDCRYGVIESFQDEAAEETHMNAPYLQAIMEDIMACLDGGYEREYLHDIE